MIRLIYVKQFSHLLLGIDSALLVKSYPVSGFIKIYQIRIILLHHYFRHCTCILL